MSTRTKRTNGRPPLLLSTLRSDRFNIRPGERRSIACPDCDVWHWINGDTTLKIREHDNKETGERCPSSLQVVLVDIAVDRWQKVQDRRMPSDALRAESRRPSRVLRKPKVPAAPPVHMIGRQAVRYPELQEFDALRQFLLALTQGERDEADESQDQIARGRRPQEWAQVDATVKAVDTERALVPAGSAVVSPIKGARLPAGTPELRWERKRKQD